MDIRKALKITTVGLLLLDLFATDNKGMNAPKCTNRTKCTGLKKNGRLKPGYKFEKGGAVRKTGK